MAFIPNTDADRRDMLAAAGAESFEDLLTGIPKSARLDRELSIEPLSEQELMAEIEQVASRSQQLLSFAGGGVYDHFVPAAVNAVIGRPEFMTAYTPYQAEVAQGTLQIIYEFQSHICRLTGMEVANASMYDGASACAEAVLLAMASTKRQKLVLATSLSPLYRQVIRTYLGARQVDFDALDHVDGVIDVQRLADEVDEETAAVIVQQPNFFGRLEDVAAIEEVTHRVGAKLIMAVDPIAQAVLKTPGELGADIVVGEGQPLGLPLSFGGPLVGFFAIRKELIRRMPGRLAARSKDIDGKPGFVLTLQTREQHIRRDKATSNICTNQALCAAAVTVHLSLVGKSGLKKIALLSMERTQEIAAAIRDLDGFDLFYDAPFVRELVVRTPRPAAEVVAEGVRAGILPGIDLGRYYPSMTDALLVAATEKRTAADVERLHSFLQEMVGGPVVSRMQG